MDIERLIAAAPDWRNQTWAQRMDSAASALFLHGYITQSQRAKVTEKIEAQFSKGIKSGAIVPREPALGMPGGGK